MANGLKLYGFHILTRVHGSRILAFVTHIQVLKRTLCFILFLLLGYFATRVLFLVMNVDLFRDDSGLEIAKSFWIGLRFDLAAILFANAILLVWASWTRWTFGPMSHWAFRLYVTILNGAFLGLNVLDCEFFKFNGKRFSQEFLLNGDDFKRHSLTAFVTYWPLFSVFVGLTLVVFFVFPRFAFQNSKLNWPTFKVKHLLVSLATLALVVIGIRGGLQLKPLNPINAFVQGSPELGALVLNSPYAFLRGRLTDLAEAPVFYPSLNEARAVIEHFRGPANSVGTSVGNFKNVIVLIIESLSLEYTGLIPGQPSYTPFLDQLALDSLVFTNNFANGRRSIEGMPSIFCALPSLTAEPIITSNLNQNELRCLPHALKNNNFETAFFHGAHNGSFHMDSFSRRAGFEHFYGFDEYGKPEDSDGHWGILDEPMLQFVAETVSKYDRPFLAGVFTLSSHHPYVIPQPLQGRFKKGPLEIHESMGYADYALQKFFETARTKPWYKDTLFVITGDHTQKSHEPAYAALTANYRVPLILFGADKAFQNWLKSNRSKLNHKVTQHADIYGTVLETLHIPKTSDEILFGASVFDPNTRGWAINFDGYFYWLRHDDRLVTLTAKERVTKFYAVSNEGFKLMESAPEEAADQALKALVTVFNLGMRTNTLYKKTDSLAPEN